MQWEVGGNREGKGAGRPLCPLSDRPRRGRYRVAAAPEDQQRPAEVLDELDAGAVAERLRGEPHER